MPDWTWFAGEPKGRCPGCSEPLRCADIMAEWRGRAYHVGCLLTTLAAFAPPPNPYHAAGTGWPP